jgi:hypothetical protein
MTIDWWEVLKTVPGLIGAGTGGLALFLNRRDAGRAERAANPRATVLLNSHAEDDGWFVIKLTFDNVKQSLALTSAEIARPRRAIIASRMKNDSGAQVRNETNKGKRIAVKWTVSPPLDGKSAAGFAHLSLQLPPGVAPTAVVLRLKGHYIAGMQEPIVIDASGRVI